MRQFETYIYKQLSDRSRSDLQIYRKQNEVRTSFKKYWKVMYMMWFVLIVQESLFDFIPFQVLVAAT